MADGNLGMSCCALRSRLRLMLGFMNVFAPFWHLGTHYWNLAAWLDQWWIWCCYFSSVVASEDFSLRNFSAEWFCLIFYHISTKQPIFCFAFWNLRFGAIHQLFSAKFWSRIPMDDEILILVFCHSSGSRLRLLLGLVNVLLKSLAFWDTLLETVCLAGLGMDLMALFFFCDIFWGLGMLRRPETIVVWRHWFGCPLRPGMPLNSPWKLASYALLWSLTLQVKEQQR